MCQSNLNKPQWFTLLPEDRLLFHFGGRILLFDLNTVPKTTCHLPPNGSHLPNRQRPVASLQSWVTSISMGFFVGDSIHFFFLTCEGVKGLIVPRSRNTVQTLECIDLLPFRNICIFADVGYDRVVLCPLFNQTIIFQFCWPEEYTSLYCTQRYTTQTVHCSFDRLSNHTLFYMQRT